MKLTPFGLKARTLRMQYDVPAKAMAEAMGVSPSHLSGIEYGDKKLSGKHIEAAALFLQEKGATAAEVRQLRDAGGESLEIFRTADLQPDFRVHLAAFARKLEAGKEPPKEFLGWLHSMG